MKKMLIGIAALLLQTFTVGMAQTQLTAEQLESLTAQQGGSVVSIHDPSVVYYNGQYTVWGSHLGVATTSDLFNWRPMGANASTFVKLAQPGDKTGTSCGFADAFNTQQVLTTKNYKGETVDLPLVDAENFCNVYDANKNGHVNGNMWAPDIIYNTQMKKWCMYLSLNGDHWASVIILLTSSSPTGPFTYQGPVVMGGFNEQTYDGVAAPSYTKTDLHLACGPLSSLPARYKRSDWGSYWPNCIDPCVFYDEEGTLWLIYGSWSGGIWMLRLDPNTGLRDYTYCPTSNYASLGASVTADPYFGTRIAGGHYVSGEGPYIQHIGNYYYLFMSYGGYAPDGGYDMRIFRSSKPEGPYMDASGNSATYTGYQLNYGPKAATNRGMHLMGAYNNWGGIQEVGECAQGHNSACTDNKGRSFVVYHTKFNDGTVGHQVRVHQLFVNEKGWLVAAPFCYRGETEKTYTKAEVTGTYHVLLHPYKLNHANYQEQTPQLITLSADGTVTGDYTGTWTFTDGKAEVTLKLNNTTYYGVFCPQHINGATKQNYKTSNLEAIAFTAMAQDGVPVWGYKLEPKSAIAWNYVHHTLPIKDSQVVSGNLPLLYETEENVELTWTSSRPDIISESGKYHPADALTAVKLTARLSCGDYYWEKEFSVRAQAETTPSGDAMSGLVAYYNFDETPSYNAYKQPDATNYDRATLVAAGNGVPKPSMESDLQREGQFIHQYFGALGNNSMTRMPNPLLSQSITGFSVSMWVKRLDNNVWDALFGFFGNVSPQNASPRLYLTGNSYLGYNNNAGSWVDINKPADNVNPTEFIPVGEWAFVTITVGPSLGVRMYVNGTNKTPVTIASSNGETAKVKNLQIDEIVKTVAALKYMYLGCGSFWGSAPACFDDLMVHNRELTSTDARAVYTLINRSYDFTTGENGTAVESVPAAVRTPRSGIYDLQGRKLQSAPARGLYIQDGRLIRR